MDAQDTIALDTADEALARSAVYRLLSQALSYPMAEAVAQLRDEDVPLALALAGPLPVEVGTALEKVAGALEGITSEELEAHHRAAFTHVHSSDRPMFETDYTASDVWRQARDLADLAGFYRAFGIELSGERPDHISVELEFLHVLTYKSAWARSQGDREHGDICARAEKHFLADHALAWMPGFAARVDALVEAGPYRAVAGLLRAVLRAEAARLAVEIREEIETLEPAGEEEPAFCEEDR